MAQKNNKNKTQSKRRFIEPVRFKTRMCRHFETTGKCPYYPRCAFSHGAEDMRSITMNANEGITHLNGLREVQNRIVAEYEKEQEAKPSSAASTVSADEPMSTTSKGLTDTFATRGDSELPTSDTTEPAPIADVADITSSPAKIPGCQCASCMEYPQSTTAEPHTTAPYYSAPPRYTCNGAGYTPGCACPACAAYAYYYNAAAAAYNSYMYPPSTAAPTTTSPPAMSPAFSSVRMAEHA